MARRNPLPPELLAEPFRTRDAAALGVSPGRLRAHDLLAFAAGLRLVGDQEPSLLARCAALCERLGPAAAISDETAALLHRMPLPLRLEREIPVHLTVATGHRAPHAADIVGHQRALWPGDVDERFGFRVTTPLRTFCDVSARLRVAEAVAMADMMVHAERGSVTPTQLADAVGRHPGRRGKRTRERVLELVDEHSESPKESELRVLLIDAGFAKPECNIDVFDSFGAFVARVDLAYRSLRIAVEYEGDYHRDPEQFRRDLARRRRLEAAGWTYIPVTQRDLTAPTQLLRDLRATIYRLNHA
ncbi:hypothetical protein FHX48_002502 [Microbacterium halimionae]|uniref:DUF559 domain-containing protein n=1 Tax=Microbacterium halimionae TaxID=1526413 RepID=A0A7W3JR42_9MICO|nr:hypothetical protein [Microbacterium halimionae]MBA8817403.1 hypothetical protein [Microbacterium halimionae]NII96037.1 hypothetical protein [Microbacterium halimionae]